MIKLLFSVPRTIRLALCLCYLCIIILLSLLPSKDIPNVQLFKYADKLVHACMYFGLTILICWTFHAESKRIRILYVVLFCSAWGLLMELSQLEMMLGRAFEWMDELSNTLGALLGAAGFAWIAGVHRKGGGD